MVKKLNPVLAQNTLTAKKMEFFTPREFQLVFGVSAYATHKFLHQHAQKGFFIKLRNGLYILKSKIPSNWEIANRLYQPSYVSLESALSFHGIIPEVVYSTTSITTRPTRQFIALGQEFSYTRLKKSAYAGYLLSKSGEGRFLIASPEKALADYLYFVSLGKKTLNDRLYLKKLDKRKLQSWVQLYKRPNLNRLIDQIYAHQKSNQ